MKKIIIILIFITTNLYSQEVVNFKNITDARFALDVDHNAVKKIIFEDTIEGEVFAEYYLNYTPDTE